MFRQRLIAVIGLFSLPLFCQSVSFNMIKLSHGMTVVGELNGDGREDGIGFTDSGTPNVEAFHAVISTGTGTYTDGPSYTLPSAGIPMAVAAADFNKDGKLDIAIVTSSGKLHVYRGNGNGTFQSPITHSLPFVPTGMAAADVNHDGKMDLILLQASTSTRDAMVVTYFGDGTGAFTAGPASDFGGQYNLQTGDFDGDGKVDLASFNCGPGGCSITVYYGDGTGRFGSPVSGSANQGLFAVADVDGDGKSDIIGSTMGYQAPDQPFLTVFYGAANRTLQAALIPTTQCTFDLPAVADFNGDGIPDIIFPEHDCNNTSTGSAQLAFLAGKGGRTFGPEQTVFNSTEAQGPGSDTTVLRANNGDSKPDFIFSQRQVNPAPGQPMDLFMMVNSSSGVFSGCKSPNSATGFRVCSPLSGSTVTSPVKFSIGASWQVPVRKTEIWVDGVKRFETFHAFADYGNLDTSLVLSHGTHSIAIITAGWDNSLESKKYSITVQ